MPKVTELLSEIDAGDPGAAERLLPLVNDELRRLARIFLRNESGRRPVYGGSHNFQDNPHWRDLILFYEYFHGDNGADLGASHQTGWTGIVARMMQLFATTTGDQVLQLGHAVPLVETQSKWGEELAVAGAGTGR